LSKRALAQIINLDVLGHMGMGWPDLTLQKDTALMFVEVKQSQDKFTHRQAYWIRNLCDTTRARLHGAPRDAINQGRAAQASQQGTKRTNDLTVYRRCLHGGE
jgi:hypothetical protein